MGKGLSPTVWKQLKILGEKQGVIKLSDLAHEMGLRPHEAVALEECWIDLRDEALHYLLPVSSCEWMELQNLLNDPTLIRSEAALSLRKKINENGPIKVVMDLLNQLELWDQEMDEQERKKVQDLDSAIRDNHLVSLTTSEGRSVSIHPCKILHLEGRLSLIGEDIQDHNLLVIPLKKVQTWEAVQTTRAARASTFEVEEFIAAIRSMNEKETRLILKIHDPITANLFPEHHFLGKPCMVTNPNGDLIWAAYVEPCDALFEWLLALGKRVEILDPVKFKEEYLRYCEEKLRKIA